MDNDDDDDNPHDDRIKGAPTSARRRPQSGRVRRTGQHCSTFDPHIYVL